MDKINEIRELMAVSKQRLYGLIDDRTNLLDPDVILLSQYIDDIISEYYKYLEDMEFNNSDTKPK